MAKKIPFLKTFFFFPQIVSVEPLPWVSIAIPSNL